MGAQDYNASCIAVSQNDRVRCRWGSRGGEKSVGVEVWGFAVVGGARRPSRLRYIYMHGRGRQVTPGGPTTPTA